MSFYNPNIQSAFDADKRAFIVLKNTILATYTLIYKIQEGFNILNISDLKAPYQLKFVQIENKIQQQNLSLVNENFVELFAEIALEVLIGRVNCFDDFVSQKLDYMTETNRNEVLNCYDSIQDFIELLVYSDIANKFPSTGERDFTKILGVVNESDTHPVFYTLFERLKFYAYLQKKMKLKINKNSIKIQDRQVTIHLKLSV